jgi:hypothetical protein
MSNRYAALTAAGFATVLFVQGAHMLDHLAQVVRKFVLG